MRVLFVCVHNAGRSRMAEAFFNALAPRPEAASAGTIPAERPHPEVVEAMREVGIEIAQGPGRPLGREMLDAAERVVTMGCSVEEACPGVLVDAEDWGLPDPRGRPPEAVRAVRDEVRRRVEALVAEMYPDRMELSEGRPPS